MSFIIVYITFGSEADAQRISSQLVTERLVACANIFPIKSMYWWNDAIQSEEEWVAIVKTVPDLWNQLKTRIEEIHPYEMPCIMKIDVEANEKYEEWIKRSTVIGNQ